jgi:hypothetical protein
MCCLMPPQMLPAIVAQAKRYIFWPTKAVESGIKTTCAVMEGLSKKLTTMTGGVPSSVAGKAHRPQKHTRTLSPCVICF